MPVTHTPSEKSKEEMRILLKNANAKILNWLNRFKPVVSGVCCEPDKTGWRLSIRVIHGSDPVKTMKETGYLLPLFLHGIKEETDRVICIAGNCPSEFACYGDTFSAVDTRYSETMESMHVTAILPKMEVNHE